MDNNEIKEVSVKNRTCYYFDDIIKFEDFDSGNSYWMKSNMKIFWFKTFLMKF